VNLSRVVATTADLVGDPECGAVAKLHDRRAELGAGLALPQRPERRRRSSPALWI
jgi:hypothetical protein